ncbi:metallophosphoesterase [Deinococcus lacus]|uniref:Metallophosphoesterase n=1 Tax=Deinococcus lacus TaxID=392561 RepID=A0ABW1YE88_9DEIO
MRVFAIADLHLSAVHPKPMTVFGPQWAGHPDAIFEHWAARVAPDDLVLLPGDLSWAMRLEDALVDLRRIGEMPGTKVILRGNHDYWWTSVAKLRAALPAGMYALQNDALRFGPPGAGLVVGGTRGWDTPGHQPLGADDERLLAREAERLRLSLSAAQKLRQAGDRLLLMLHYPPPARRMGPTPERRRAGLWGRYGDLWAPARRAARAVHDPPGGNAGPYCGGRRSSVPAPAADGTAYWTPCSGSCQFRQLGWSAWKPLLLRPLLFWSWP